MLADLEEAAVRLGTLASPKIRRWNEAFAGYRPLIEKVLSQTERRVLNGETVPAQQKIVSLFEPHADIILKGSRAAQYGHKLNLVSGKSGLILDLVIEAGNPADSDRLLPMLERHIDRFGCAPRQVAADGGYATGLNLRQAKARGGPSALLGHRYTVAAARAQPAGSLSGMQPSASRTSPSDQT
jgi:IS5 family transposase